MEPTNNDLENRFNYHSQPGLAVTKMDKLRQETKSLAYLITDMCPDSREKSLALTNLEQTMFWANASIARHSEE